MQSWCYTARSANRSRTLWSAVKKVILQNSLWILYLIPYELNLPVSLTFCWHTKHMTEKLMTELGAKKKQKQIPLYGGIHWCPHPLLQHFCFLGQSLAWEHISAHTPNIASSTLFFGHTPGFAGPADMNITEKLWQNDQKKKKKNHHNTHMEASWPTH